MSEKIFVKPATGLIIHNFSRKDFRPLAPEGELVDADPQWLRYEGVGDVIIGEPPTAKPSKISKKGDEA